MKKLNILIIEDEPSISDNLEYALSTEGFETVTFHTGKEGVNYLRSANYAKSETAPALVILDIGLPDMNGFDVCKEIRRESNIPIIFLTARDSEIDRVVGLEMGGDDYVTKPFSPRELTARVRAILRRTGDTGSNFSALPAKDADAKFALIPEERNIKYYGETLQLSHYEYEILALMIKSPGILFSRADFMNKIWDTPEMSMDRTVDTHIKTIRAKLYKIKSNENPIVTKRGFGYLLEL
jgi:two-component system catabolic regulation response regulator CreB